MRYYTKELLEKINDCDCRIRAEAEKEWCENDLAYQRQFEEAKRNLTRGFVKNYMARHGLHDYTVLGIETKKRGREYTCELQMTDGSETILITMTGLQTLQISIDSFRDCILGELRWLYSEFEQTPEGGMRLSVLCDMQNELQFVFKTIKIVKQ